MPLSSVAQTAIKDGFDWLMSSENISLQSKKGAFIFLYGDEKVTFIFVTIVDGQVLIKNRYRFNSFHEETQEKVTN